jgi:hypothetical protein
MWPYKMRWLWNGAFLCPCTCHYLLVLFHILETSAELHILSLVYLLLSHELWCTWNTTIYSHVPTISCTNCVIPQTVQSHTPILLWKVMHLMLSFHPLCTCDWPQTICPPPVTCVRLPFMFYIANPCSVYILECRWGMWLLALHGHWRLEQCHI